MEKPEERDDDPHLAPVTWILPVTSAILPELAVTASIVAEAPRALTKRGLRDAFPADRSSTRCLAGCHLSRTDRSQCDQLSTAHTSGGPTCRRTKGTRTDKPQSVRPDRSPCEPVRSVRLSTDAHQRLLKNQSDQSI